MTFLFAPGAGAGSDSDWMVAWAARLRTIAPVVPFDYAYRMEGRKVPDRLPKLIARHTEVLHALPGPVWLAGKSMGGRIGCHVALTEPVVGLICFGYPLIGANGKVRDEVLLGLRRPVLFVQGTRDPMCPLAHLEQVRAQMEAESEVIVVENGDHDLEGRGTQGQYERVIAGIQAFVTRPRGPTSRTGR